MAARIQTSARHNDNQTIMAKLTIPKGVHDVNDKAKERCTLPNKKNYCTRRLKLKEVSKQINALKKTNSTIKTPRRPQNDRKPSKTKKKKTNQWCVTSNNH